MNIGDTVYVASLPVNSLPFHFPRKATVIAIDPYPPAACQLQIEGITDAESYFVRELFTHEDTCRAKIIQMAQDCKRQAEFALSLNEESA